MSYPRAYARLLCATVAVTHLSHADPALSRFGYEKAEMGIPLRVVLYAQDEATAKRASDAAFARIEQLNSVFSDYDPDSELSRLSRTSGLGRFVPVTSDLWNTLVWAQTLAEKTGGAFDITVGPLVSLWRRARRKRELPAPELIAEMKARVGWQYLALDPTTKSAQLLRGEMRLDLASIAKGYAIDRALEVLRDHGIAHALVTGNGDMAASDAPPGERGWKIEVPGLEPGDGLQSRVILLRNGAIGTSGDLYQYIEINGVRYSHIVDPHTGYGLTDHSLVNVLGTDCATASSLATAASALGPERGLALIEAHEGFAGRMVRKPGEKVDLRTSSRWPVDGP